MLNIRYLLFLACLPGFVNSSQAADLYRWVDSSGKVYYGDVLPPGALNVEVKKFPKDSASNEYLPYDTRRAQQNFPVTLYVGDGCGAACNQARELLNKRGIPFSEKTLKSRQDIEAFKRVSGFDAVAPTLKVGKEYLKGFEASQWNGELDLAGYPKTASYRQRVASPSTVQSSTAPSAETSSAETPSTETSSTEDQPVTPEQ